MLTEEKVVKLMHPSTTYSVFRFLVIVCSVVLIFGASAVAGKMPNDQYTNIAPLPGAGVALNSEGDLDGQGALQINIPVAYTPKWGYISAGAYWGDYPDRDHAFGNGSGIFAMGFFNKPAIYMSGMQVSRVWEEAKAVSGQVAVLEETESRPAVSVGVQDILEKEDNQRSLYIVATKQVELFDRQAFASIGYGDGRFLSRPFGGLSVPVNDYLNFALEWDGFQVNSGVGIRPGGRDGWITFLGAYNGQDGWLVGASVAYDFTP